MEFDGKQKEIICIQYPGMVKNIDNALKTLGGINQISSDFSLTNRRLQLNFMPNNIYAKPAFGDCRQTTGMLIKLKIRKNKKSNTEPPKLIEESVSIVGFIRKIYQFESICDFQHLPVAKNQKTNKVECIYNELVPRGIITSKWLTESNPYGFFLPPASMSRLDAAPTKLFRKEQGSVSGVSGGSRRVGHGDSGDNLDDDDGLIKKTRLRRIKKASYLSFHLTDPIPEKFSMSRPEVENYLKLKFITIEQYEKVKKLFDERPIMSKMVAIYETKIDNEKLKYILPLLSYYYTTGPWRIMWVRFGYDPRKDFESRYYQQLDYRTRMYIGVRDHIEVKSMHSVHKSAHKKSNEPKTTKNEFYPYFEMGRFPQSRQCIYQYCDIRVPKIREMLDKIPTPMSGAQCNEKSGWLPSNFDDICREILSNVIKDLVVKNKCEAQFNEAEDEEEDDDQDEDEEDDDADDDVDVDDESFSEEEMDVEANKKK